MNLIKIRNLLLVFFVFIILLFIGYKYFEWNTFKDIANSYNTSWLKELSLTSEGGIPSKDYNDELANNKNFKQSDRSAFLKGLDEINAKLNIVVNVLEGYSDQLEQDRKIFAKLKNKTNFLFGERGNIAKKIVDDQLAYYDLEQKGNKISLANYYGVNVLFNIWRDSITLTNFLDKIGSSTDASFIGKYFSELAPLEKYTSSNFKFEHEDEIKQYYPDFGNKINSYKKYFASYYTAEKDFSVGNTETAQLELQTTTDNWAKISIDYSSLGNEQNPTLKEATKEILRLVSDQSMTIKNYKLKKLYKYPLLPSIDVWKEDLVLCQMYDYKTYYYYSVTSKYPTAKTVDGLIKELSKISPKTDNVDGIFDKSAMKFINSDKKLDFTCIDKYSGTRLNYFLEKP